MSGYSQDAGVGHDDYSNNESRSGRVSSDRNSYDQNSGQKRYHSDHSSRGGEGVGYGSGGSSYNRSRNDYQNNNNDNYGSSAEGYNRGRNNHRDNSETNADDNRMETQRDTIFIQNLPRTVTVSELKDVFSKIGIIKNDKKTNAPKIWIYKDKATGEGKGEATITYEDEEAAQAAIKWYHGKEVLSNIVQISLATRRVSAFGNRGGPRGNRGGFRSRGGGDYGGYRGRGGNHGSDYRNSGTSSGGEYRGSGRGASHGSSRDNRSNPY